MANLPGLLTTICIGLTLSGSAYSATEVSPEAEFKRALSIIEKTQLDIFSDITPENKTEVILRFNTLSEAAAAELEPSTSDSGVRIAEKRIELMRSLISETIDTYNDQYANYISPDALRKYSERRSGSYEGIGLKFRTVTDNYPLVIGPLVNGPLESSDLLPGDKLIEANGRDLKGLNNRNIIEILKGPADTIVRLKVQRDNATHSVVATRSAVDLHYARSEVIENDIGYIQISRFGGKTHKRVLALLNELLKKNVTGLILDLRNNPGGSTRAARAVVSMFSNEKYIYCERNKAGTIKQLPRHGEHITDLPLAVLVNGDSMSSSEIVAGALQAYERGIIIGSPTFGKGLVQRVFNLKEPLGGAIRTTIAVFGTPDHRIIHSAGIVPDIYVETAADFMFKRTGSLNIKQNARNFQRTLLEEGVRKKHPHKAKALIEAPDRQLQTAIAEINKLKRNR